MAQYFAEIKGARGEVHRLGTKNSGARANVRGWNIGCEVEMKYDEEKQKDMVYVYRTSGSNGTEARKLIATYAE